MTLDGAAARLAEVLAQENAALAALDLPAAVSVLAEKQDAAAAFVAALRQAPGSMPAQADRLRGLAEENRHLLEHALLVQRRVVGLVARAVPKALAPAARYGATGSLAHARTAPVLVSARV